MEGDSKTNVLLSLVVEKTVGARVAAESRFVFTVPGARVAKGSWFTVNPPGANVANGSSEDVNFL